MDRVTATVLVWSLALAGCEACSGDGRPGPRAGTEPTTTSAPPVAAAAPGSASASSSAASAAPREPLADLGVTKPLPGGFVLYDDANLRDSQAPLVAVIVPASEAARFYSLFGSKKVTFWTPTGTDVSALDRARNEVERRQPGIAARSIEYRYQVLGIEVDGRRRLFVNAFCREEGPWTREPVSVDDGGDCYFTFEYELDSGAVVDLRVNGEG